MPTHNAPRAAHPLRAVLSLRDFRLLFAGVSTSLLGDQFALIATPWLVLQLTGDPLALGIVLALEGVPRALFMLFGGNYSPGTHGFVEPCSSKIHPNSGAKGPFSMACVAKKGNYWPSESDSLESPTP
jgi:hypothetical protein